MMLLGAVAKLAYHIIHTLSIEWNASDLFLNIGWALHLKVGQRTLQLAEIMGQTIKVNVMLSYCLQLYRIPKAEN